MNSKSRVAAVLDGKIPDRVPIAEYAVDFDTVEKIIGHETYFRAKAKSKIALWNGHNDEVAQSWLNDHIELHQKLDLDIVNISAAWQIPPDTDDPPPRQVDSTTWEDKYGRIYKLSEVTAEILCVSDPVLDAKVYSVEDYQKEPVMPVRDSRSWNIVDTLAETFKKEKYILGPSGGEVGLALAPGGVTERDMIELAQNPEVAAAAAQYLLKQQNMADEVFIHPDSDAVFWGMDFSFNSGPFISPVMFKELFLEPNKLRAENVHQKYGRKIFKHCCGNNKPLLDFFIEMGYDVYQGIQPTAGMDICELKKTHGDKITLWGGVGVENLVSGTADEVRHDVRRAMEYVKPGGNFILGSSHSIAVGVKYENYMAMLDEYHKLCDY